jgi:hypothetical protein
MTWNCLVNVVFDFKTLVTQCSNSTRDFGFFMWGSYPASFSNVGCQHGGEVMVLLHQIAGTSWYDLYSVDWTLNHIGKKQKRKIYINTCACIYVNCVTCKVKFLRGDKNSFCNVNCLKCTKKYLDILRFIIWDIRNQR